jgi:hypothetical protein
MTIASPSWADTTQTAEFIGIHPETLLRLRRLARSPFREGRDYRWLGLGKKKIQWNPAETDKSLWAYKREPAEEVETFSREPVAPSR